MRRRSNNYDINARGLKQSLYTIIRADIYQLVRTGQRLRIGVSQAGNMHSRHLAQISKMCPVCDGAAADKPNTYRCRFAHRREDEDTYRTLFISYSVMRRSLRKPLPR